MLEKIKKLPFWIKLILGIIISIPSWICFLAFVTLLRQWLG
jgi:hypothetical protein